MDLKRSLFLVILAFGVGFVGSFLIRGAQHLWPDVFPEGGLLAALEGGPLAALFLAVLWGTPRGILERKPLEMILGCALVFGGLLLLPLFEQRYLTPVTKLANLDSTGCGCRAAPSSRPCGRQSCWQDHLTAIQRLRGASLR